MPEIVCVCRMYAYKHTGPDTAMFFWYFTGVHDLLAKCMQAALNMQRFYVVAVQGRVPVRGSLV